MSRSARSMVVFGVYIGLLGVALLVAPNALFAVFGVAATREVWIRVVGVVLLVFAYYDVQAGRAEVVEYFRWSVAGRVTVFVAFAAFALLALGPPVIVVFGTADLAGAVWTAAALRADRRTQG